MERLAAQPRAGAFSPITSASAALIGAAALALWASAGVLGWVTWTRAGERRPPWAAILLGPLAFLVFPWWGRSTSPSRVHNPRLPSDEELLYGTPFFSHEIRALKREGRFGEAADILVVIVDALEEKARRHNAELPHWHYEQLAESYRRLGQRRRERWILKRFLAAPSQKESARRRLQARLDTLE